MSTVYWICNDLTGQMLGREHGGAEFYQVNSDSQDGKCQGETTLMAGIHLSRQEWMKNSYWTLLLLSTALRQYLWRFQKSPKSTSPGVDPPCTCHAQLKPSHCWEATSSQPRPCWSSDPVHCSGELKFHLVLREQNCFAHVGDIQSLKVIYKVELMLQILFEV